MKEKKNKLKQRLPPRRGAKAKGRHRSNQDEAEEEEGMTNNTDLEKLYQNFNVYNLDTGEQVRVDPASGLVTVER